MLRSFSIVFIAGLCMVLAAGAARAVDSGSGSGVTFAGAIAAEEAGEANIFSKLTRWDVEKVREVARNFDRLPEPVAINTLWLMANAPRRIEATLVIAPALTSKSPAIRRLAADILIAGDASDSKRVILGMLATENDPEVIKHVVTGLAMQPTAKAVRNMMDIIYESNLKAPAVDIASEQLRRLTRAKLYSANDWRDWWLDNEPTYSN